MTTLFFVRHGVTEENLQYTLIGHTDPSLHPQGIEQAHQVAKTLMNEEIEAVYTSPLKRCLETAECIAQTHHSLPVQICPSLQEINLGIVDGMSSFLAYERYRSLLDEALDESLPDFAFPGGERRSEALQRFHTALNKICSRHPHGHICVVTHGGLLGLWLATLHGDSLGRFRHWQPRHGTITRVERKNDSFLLIDNR
ncbi:histidine phosphatase family protein [Alicyclobacillus tolerans]|uniref:Broad specificity phosphatase PhoE n=1 Tax=Alicyclobacillus tolerans TaxID=90970 RepID=A0ABT9LSI7_9BACL|nr:histidine phosphatase family protein [Alicyclobacillus tengchongensis]MDP9727222.1 broad specificity phosphatase PhoE [Alicyclobacillus tengchongensis]